MIKFKFLQNLPFGLFLGSAFAVILASILDSDISENLMKLYTFVFSAIATLFAAGLALAGSLNSASVQIEIDEANRMRRLNSAKASLPYALSDTINCALAGLSESASRFHGQGDATTNMGEKIRPKKTSIDTITSVIENAAPNEGKILSMVLANFQVYTSRMQSLPNASPAEGRRHQNLEAVAYWAYLYLLTGHCFDFARGQSQISNNITEDSIENSMRNALGDGFAAPYLGENPAIGMYAGVYYRSHNRALRQQ